MNVKEYEQPFLLERWPFPDPAFPVRRTGIIET
jgi:hypothetical protein